MPHNSAKAAQEWPEEHEAQRARAKLPDLIRLKIHEMHTKSNPWRPHLATHRTQRMSATSCQTPQEIPRGTMSDWAMAERGGGHITLERCLLYCCGWFIFQTYLHNVTTPGYCLFRIWLWSMWPLFRLDANVTRCYFSAVQSERNKTGNCDIQITYINFSFSFRNMCLYSFCKCNISLGFDNQNPSSAWMEFSPRLHPPPCCFPATNKHKSCKLRDNTTICILLERHIDESRQMSLSCTIMATSFFWLNANAIKCQCQAAPCLFCMFHVKQ